MEFIYTNDKSAVGVTVAIFDHGGYGDVIANRNRTSSTMTKRLTAVFYRYAGWDQNEVVFLLFVF